MPCLGFELRNNYSTRSHPAHAPAAAAASAKTAAVRLSHARDLFARARTDVIIESVRVAGSADRLTETGGRILPGQTGQGERAWSMELGQPPCRSPPAGRVQHPCARRWPWGGEVVSQQKRAEKRRRLLDSPPACWHRVLTQAPAAIVSEQLPKSSREPRQRCTSPAHRITASRPSLSTSSIIISSTSRSIL